MHRFFRSNNVFEAYLKASSGLNDKAWKSSRVSWHGFTTTRTQTLLVQLFGDSSTVAFNPSLRLTKNFSFEREREKDCRWSFAGNEGFHFCCWPLFVFVERQSSLNPSIVYFSLSLPRSLYVIFELIGFPFNCIERNAAHQFNRSAKWTNSSLDKQKRAQPIQREETMESAANHRSKVNPVII